MRIKSFTVDSRYWKLIIAGALTALVIPFPIPIPGEHCVVKLEGSDERLVITPKAVLMHLPGLIDGYAVVSFVIASVAAHRVMLERFVLEEGDGL